MRSAIVLLALLALPGLVNAQTGVCGCTSHGNCTCSAGTCPCGPCGHGAWADGRAAAPPFRYGGYAPARPRVRLSIEIDGGFRQPAYYAPPTYYPQFRQPYYYPQYQPYYGRPAYAPQYGGRPLLSAGAALNIGGR